MKNVLNGLVVVFVLAVVAFAEVGAQAGATITLLDRNNKPVISIVDGNQVSLKIELSEAVTADSQVDFLLADLDLPVASCTVPSGQRDCQSASFATLGWFWNPDGSAQPQREVSARVNGQPAGGSLNVAVGPRPVVLVHGFNANWHTWDTYLGPQGYLATVSLHGYAVGDGQVPGVMNTGSLGNPAAHTNTIAENAVILGQYIDNVQKITGAEKVDLVVHSMGGMISRYYIDRVMTDVDVAQLVILGTPMAGSDCAILPAALGLLLPATIEIQPSYMVGIFNHQIYHRHGIPFHALAGTKLSDSVQSPCTPVPSDIVVTIDSVKAIPMPVQEIALLHTDLNVVPEVFNQFVKPLLETPPGKFEVAVDPPAGSNAPASGQFTKVYTGHVNPGETQQVVINIDPGVTVANFAMYDTTRTLTTTVVGANGKEIVLDAEKNGLIRVDDPSTMIYLGYGFKQPKPGKWVITVATTESTPPSGADFAITAQFNGGAILSAKTNTLIPNSNEPVTISAELTDEGVALTLLTAQARLTKPDGSVETLDMKIQNNTASLEVKPDQSGIYGIEVSVTSKTLDGFAVDRGASLAFVAQPSKLIVTVKQYLLAAGIALLALWIVRGIVRRFQKRRRVT
jgi:pimeloyl-ACP methyl ester carboxylesterase